MLKALSIISKVIVSVILMYLLGSIITYVILMPEPSYYTSEGIVILEKGIDYPTMLEWLNPFSDLSKYNY